MEKLTFDRLYALLEGMSEETYVDMTSTDKSKQLWLAQYGWTLAEFECAVYDMFDFKDAE
jgi:hypothetical protein